MTTHRHHPFNDARTRAVLASSSRNRSPWRVFITAAIVAWCFTPQAHAQEPPPPSPPAEETEPEQPVEEPPKIILVEGQVTDPMGSGVKGAAVTVRRKTDDGSEGTLIASATTDEMGDFEVTVEEAMIGDVVVTIKREPFGAIVREVRVGEGEYPPYIGEEMRGRLVLVGEVIDARTSSPLADADIRLEINNGDRYATSDKAGRFRFENLSPGRGKIAVEAEGFGRETMAVESLPEELRPADSPSTPEPKDDQQDDGHDHAHDDEVHDMSDLGDFGLVQVRLKPERILEVLIEDDLGKPIGGVAMELLDDERADFRTFVSDKDGRVTIRGVHYDALLLTVRLTHQDHVSDADFAHEINPPVDEIKSSHRLEMHRAGRITGKVIDADTRRPIGGARVMTGAEADDFSPRDFTGDRGRFLITGVKPGPCVITIHARGYAPELKTVEVKVGEVVEQDVRLGPPALIHGVVRNKENKPVPGAFVDATKWRGHHTLGLRAITTADGEFVIVDAPHDAFEIIAYAHRTEEVAVTVPAGATEPIEIVLPDAPERPAGGALAGLKVGDAAPDFTVTTLTGQRIALADLKGKTVLVDFWATWCGPCVAELPHVKKAYARFSERADFVMIGISLDFDQPTLEKFIKKEKLPWHHVYGDNGGAQTVADAFAVSGIPAMFIINGEGKIVAADLRGEQIISEVEKALSSQALGEETKGGGEGKK